MPLTDIQKVRTLVGDMNKAVVQEHVANGDSATTIFQVDLFPMRTGTLTVLVTGAVKTSASANFPLGLFDLTGSAPVNGDRILATYQYNALSDDEVQACIDLASAAGTLLAASYAARSLAGNAARYFSYTQGQKSVDKDQMSKKFIDLAESLEEAYENNISVAGMIVTVTTFDDSGTAFDGYSTASSYVDTGTNWI